MRLDTTHILQKACFLTRKVLLVALFSVSIAPGIHAYVVDNKTYTNGAVEVHNWAWAVSEVNGDGGGSIGFDIQDTNALVMPPAVFSETVTIDGENDGTNLVTFQALYFNSPNSEVLNAERVLSVSCEGSKGHNFLNVNQIDGVEKGGDGLWFDDCTVLSVQCSNKCDFTTCTLGSVSCGSTGKFEMCRFSNARVTAGDKNTFNGNIMTGGGSTFYIECRSDNTFTHNTNIAVKITGDDNDIDDCTIDGTLDIDGRNNTLRYSTIASAVYPTIRGYGTTVDNCVFTGNSIGLRVLGTNTTVSASRFYANTGVGLYAGGADLQVGDTLLSKRCYIYLNGSHGISLVNAEQVRVEGNYIGTTNRYENNTAGNGGTGIRVENCTDVRIGQSVAGGQNLIRSNAGGGVSFVQDEPNVDRDLRVVGNVIKQNVGFGVDVQGGHDVEIYGNYIGSDENDTPDQGNIGHGIHVRDSTGIRIGGSLAGAMNIISANKANGIYFEGESDDDFLGGEVQGNYIGVNRNGTAALPNLGSGVLLERSRGVTVGGSEPDQGNVISGNAQYGVKIARNTYDDSAECVVAGNRIGVDAGATSAVPNACGIYCSGVSNTIGGTVTGACNIVSGNTGDGIRLVDDASSSLRETSWNIVQGNYVGVDITGASALPNGGHGLALCAGEHDVGSFTENSVGGTNGPGCLAGNVISGNASNGIDISLYVVSNYFDGNIIGLSKGGDAAVPNSGHGVEVSGNCYYGFFGTREGNVISGNTGDGVRVSDGYRSLFLNNWIGCGPDGVGSFGNGGNGVSLVSGSWEVEVGRTRSDANFIGGNGGCGVYNMGQDNTIAGNYIGIGPLSSVDCVPNLGTNQVVLTQRGATLGGVGDAGNVIAGEIGVLVEDISYSSGDLVGNIIGYAPGSSQVCTNMQTGILVRNAGSLDIGGGTNADISAGNCIGGARRAGIILENTELVRIYNNAVGCGTNLSGYVTNSGHGIIVSTGSVQTIMGERFNIARPNYIAGNEIGVLATGATNLTMEYGYVGMTPEGTALGNRSDGIRLEGGPRHRIGAYEDFSTVISGNGGAGLRAVNCNGLRVYSCYIGVNAAGNVAVPNAGGGVVLDNCIEGAVGQMVYANVISGNTGDGILVTGADSISNSACHNRIGLAADTAAAIPNSRNGIRVSEASGSFFQCNFIANNGLNGILVSGNTAVGNEITRNSIYNNGVLGIALGTNMPPSNDEDDTDTGPNNLQNCPVITNIYIATYAPETVSTRLGCTMAYGTLDSRPNRDYRLDFYWNNAANTNGYVEGERYLDQEYVTSDSDGHVNFVLYAYTSPPPSAIISATAVDEETGDTSVFSVSNVCVAPYAVPTGVMSIDVTPDTAAWSLTAPVTYAGARNGTGDLAATDVPIGAYKVCYQPRMDYSKPDDQTQMVAQGGTVVFRGVYGDVLTNAPPPASGVSHGAYTNMIRVWWTQVTNAVSYNVWRASSNSAASAGVIDNVASNTRTRVKSRGGVWEYYYDDTDIVNGVPYYYWIQSVFTNGVGTISYVNSGYAALPDSQRTSYADIRVSDVVFLPATIQTSAHPAILSLTLSNAGPSDIDSVDVVLDVYMSSNSVLDTLNDEWIGNATLAIDAAAGASMSVSLDSTYRSGITVREDLKGSYNVFVEAHYLSGLRDPSQDNNTSMREGSVTVGQRPTATLGDFSGAGRTDLTVYDALRGNWYSLNSGQTLALWAEQWGAPRFEPVPGDYNGDGISDLAVYEYNGGNWYVREADGSLLTWMMPWGGCWFSPVPGDYNGDGISDMAVYSRAAGQWFISSIDRNVIAWATAWGGPGLNSVPGDYNGDGIWDLALYAPESGRWYIRSVSGDVLAWGVEWGGAEFSAVPGDYDGDDLWDMAVYAPESGRWYIRLATGRVFAWGVEWGGNGFSPVAGDYDGDGIWDLAVYSSDTGKWYVYSLANGVLMWGTAFGGPGMFPLMKGQ